MIRSLRARHCVMISGLAVALPAIFILALVKRHPVPPSDVYDLVGKPDSALVPLGAEWTVLMTPLVQARFLAAQDDSIPIGISLSAMPPIGAPDVLVYWAPSAGDSTALPSGATLLGPLHDHGPERYRLPVSGSPEGYLILYSLAHRERLAMAKLPPVTRRTPAAE